MKKLFLCGLSIAALSVFLTASDIRAEDNILVNPGFEKGSEGWTEWNSVEGCAGGKITTETFHSGTFSGKRWLTNPTDLIYSAFIQQLNVEVQKDDVVSFSGWLMSPMQDPLKNGAEAFLVIEFWKGAGKVAFPESERLRGQTQWKKFEVSGVAPEGTTLVKVCCFLFGSKGTKGTVYFDDLNVEVKPKRTPY